MGLDTQSSLLANVKQHLGNARVAAVANWPNSQHLDHLAPLADFLSIPLLVDDAEMLDMMQKYYPSVTTHKLPPLMYIPDIYDVLIVTAKMWKSDMGGIIEMCTEKKVRFIYCPHGNSDKCHAKPSLDPFLVQDDFFFYGNQMKRNLASRGVAGGHHVGNYRLAYYQKYQHHCDKLVEHLRSEKKTILYAPTWNDQENLSSFSANCEQVLRELSEDFNLIVKVHPILVEQEYARIIQLEGRYSAHFLTHFPLVYPILSIADAYLGDFSSVGYDFLYFDRPMFFIESDQHLPDRSKLLHQSGKILPKDHICQFIHANWDQQHLSEQRQQLYQDAFF